MKTNVKREERIEFFKTMQNKGESAMKKKRGKFLINRSNCKELALQKVSEKYIDNPEAAPVRVSEDFYGWLGQEVSRLIENRVNNRVTEGKSI